MGYCIPQARFLPAALHGISITKDGCQAEVTSNPSRQYKSMTVQPVIQNIGFIKCRLHQTPSNMLVGIGHGITDADTPNFQFPSSYGWDGISTQYKHGKGFPVPKVQLSEGDWILLKADLCAGRLSIITSQAITPWHVFFVPDDQHQFVFHVVLFNDKHKIELLPVTPEDQHLFV